MIMEKDTIPTTLKFINKSQGEILTYNWFFGNDTTSLAENPTILFDKWGKFDVKLIISDGYFSDTTLIEDKIITYPPVIPFFTTKFENRFIEEKLNIYGLDGIQTYENKFVYLSNVGDKYKLLICTNKDGEIIWEKTLVKGRKVVQTADSCFLILDDSTTSRKEIYVAKYSKNGDFIWDRFHKIENSKYDTPRTILVTKDSGYVVASDSYDNLKRAAIIKVDKDGKQTMYKGTLPGQYSDVIEINDSLYCLIYHNPGSNNIMISKISIDGKYIRTYECGESKKVFSCKSYLTKDLDFIIAGWYDNEYNKHFPYIIKVDSNGTKIWEYFSKKSNSQYYTITSISDTLFAATGNFNNQLGVDIFNIKGVLLNSIRFPYRTGFIQSIITTKDNDLFLTGSITPPYKLSQLYTLLLKHPYIITSLEDEQNDNIANPKQPFSIFPNPTNSTATLQYKIETPTQLKIELIDFMGTKVSEIENTFKEAGEYNSIINFESLAIAKGIYFVRFIANGNVFVSKVIFY